MSVAIVPEAIMAGTLERLWQEATAASSNPVMPDPTRGAIVPSSYVGD